MKINLYYCLLKEGYACLLAQSLSNLGVNHEIATQSSFSATKRTQYFISPNAENPAVCKEDFANGSNTFKALFNKIPFLLLINSPKLN